MNMLTEQTKELSRLVFLADEIDKANKLIKDAENTRQIYVENCQLALSYTYADKIANMKRKRLTLAKEYNKLIDNMTSIDLYKIKIVKPLK